MKRRSAEDYRIQLIARLLTIVVCLGLLLGCAWWLDSRTRRQETRGDYRKRYAYDNVIEIDGVSYRQRKELTTVLLMGVDQDSDAEITGFRSGGQADFLRLIIIDPRNRVVSQLALDRDTMTPIKVLGVLGSSSGMRSLQLCLSHGYGDGKEQSCANTVDAVSNFLLGTQITHFAAVNLDGIGALNDWAGGVTVTLEDDFSRTDPAMTPGRTLTLNARQAEVYVRERMDVGDGTNAARMNRQNVYLHELSDRVGERLRESKDEISGLIDVLTPYIVTDFSRGRLINEAWAAREYEFRDAVEIPGTHRIGEDGFVEFHADEEALQRIVLELFYTEV